MFVRIKKHIIAFLGTIGILILAFIFLGIQQQPTQKNPVSVFPTPTSLPTIASTQRLTTYTEPNHKYTLNYPAGWNTVTNSNPNDSVSTFLFTEQNAQYRFRVSPPGQINLAEIDNGVTSDETEVNYQGKLFVQTLWKKQGIPLYISAVPKDVVTTPYFFSMEIPPQNTNTYVTIFNQLVASFKQQ